MLAAIRDNNPVVFLEAKGLYGFFRTDLREEVPLGAEHEVEIGAREVRREGSDLTMLTYGAMVWTSLAAAEQLAREGVAAEVIDLRTLGRSTWSACARRSTKTHRALVLARGHAAGAGSGRAGGDPRRRVFWQLERRSCASPAPDTPVPYSPPLEQRLPAERRRTVVAAARRLASESVSRRRRAPRASTGRRSRRPAAPRAPTGGRRTRRGSRPGRDR